MKSNADAMVLASLTADSLALGVHWIYDTDRIDKEYGRVQDLLPPGDESYHPTKKRGDFTHYGDRCFHLLQFVKQHSGRFQIEEYATAYKNFYQEYDGYLDNATKTTLEAIRKDPQLTEGGSKSRDLGGAAIISPLIFSSLNSNEPVEKNVSRLIALSHNGPGSVETGLFLVSVCSDILFHDLTPSSAIEKALESTISDIELKMKISDCFDNSHSLRQQVKDYGQFCAINGALPGAVAAILNNEDNLEEALIETVMAGGDSAARGMVVGMILGAYQGKEAIPVKWLNNLQKKDQIKQCLSELGPVS